MYNFEIGVNSLRCIILSGGTIGDFQWLAGVVEKGDYVICADGGSEYAAALGIIPRLIVGDMDSVNREILEYFAGRGTIIKEYPADKDDTDTALALGEALAVGPAEIVIIGALGTRFDHSLANVHLLRAAWERGVRARIIDEYNEISLVGPQQPALVKGRPGDLFSLLPLTERVTGVQVRGARWPLRDAVFAIGNPYGISNRLVDGEAEVSVASGLLLLIKVSKRGECLAGD